MLWVISETQMDIQNLIDTLETVNPVIEAASQLPDTLIVRTDGIVQIKNSIEQGTDYKFLIATIISVLSISFIIWDRIKRAKISGKILSLTYSKEANFSVDDFDGNKIEIKGIRYCLKLSINVLYKNIFYSDVVVKMKYPNDKETYIGRQYFTGNDKWTFSGITKTLKIPDDKFISFNNVLEKDKTLFLYSTFFIERDFENFSEVEFLFKSPTGKIHKLGPLKSSDFHPELAYFEKEIWKENP